MTTNLFSFALISALVSTLEIVDFGPIELDHSNFYEKVVSRDSGKLIGDKPWFIKFFAPWCGHCKRLAPTWHQFSVEYTDQINVGHVDCTTDSGKTLCQEYNVNGYPTLYFFPADQENSGKYYEYQGARSLDNLKRFALDGEYLTSSVQAD